MDIIGIFKKELAVIKRAPIMFMLAIIVVGVITCEAEYKFIFQQVLAQKDNLIMTLQMQLNAAKHQPETPPPPQQAPTTTGPATTSGDYSPAVSGTVGSFNATPVPVPKAKGK